MSLTKSIIIGKAIGDALGVPVEFYDRSLLKENPVVGYREYGSHKQPKGTWSDDTSMALCIVDGLNVAQGFKLETIATNFTDWLYENAFTPHGEVFDYGMTTRNAITKIMNGVELNQTGGIADSTKGNGALMRTLALVPYLTTVDKVEDRWGIIVKVGGLTHNTMTSHLACFFLVEYALNIIEFTKKIPADIAKLQAFAHTQDSFIEFAVPRKYDISEFNLLLTHVELLPIEHISSSGFVVNTLVASIWSILTTVDFEEAVLQAVNLGDDSDTTGAVTGGLAGILYGFDSIPKELIKDLVEFDYLLKICDTHENVIKDINTDK